MLSHPFTYIETSGNHLLIKYKCTKTNYEIMISNLKYLWSETLKSEQIELIFKNINNDIEMPIDGFLQIMENAIINKENKTSFKFSIVETQNCQLDISFFVSDIVFKWTFNLILSDSENTYNFLNEPFMMMTSFLLFERKKLLDIIYQKEKLISELKKIENKSNTKNSELIKFDENSFQAECVEDFNEDIKHFQKFLFQESNCSIISQIHTCLTKFSIEDKVETNEKQSNKSIETTEESTIIVELKSIKEEHENRRRKLLEENLKKEEYKTTVKKKKIIKF